MSNPHNRDASSRSETASVKGNWWVYMIEAQDRSLYTGITTDVEARFRVHLSGKGARYFRGRPPLRVVYQEDCCNRSEASRREAAIKKLSRSAKLALVASPANRANAKASRNQE